MEETTNIEEETLVDNPDEHEFDGTTEEESGEESEVEDSSDLSEDDGTDEGGIEADPQTESQKRAKTQIDRLKAEKAKLKAENERLKKGSSQEGGEVVATNSELIERTYLAANGIKDREVQDEVMRLAHKFDVPVDAAMDDTDIRARAETLIKKKKATQAVAKGTGGAGAKTKGVDYYTAYFTKNGDFPAGIPNEMIAKVTDKLAKQ
jgi:hypothetical protein